MPDPEFTCTQHMGCYGNSFLCGKAAKWNTPDGRAVCGVHKEVVNRFLSRTNSEKRCTAITETETTKAQS